MKRSELRRTTPLARGTGLKRSGPVRAKRAAPRRREAPRWDSGQWEWANHQLMVRSGGVCEICGHPPKPGWGFERHHRKRRRDGGDRLANIVLLCGGPEGCHARVTVHPGEARQHGWIVSVSRDPADVPFLWRNREWVYLDDDGNKIPWVEELAPADAHA